MAIPAILPEGLTLLAGKPKLGKSWLALCVAFAVAAGDVALGTHPVTQGEVLYLASEDNERRLQSRTKHVLASMTSILNTMAFELHWPGLDQGGLTYVEKYLRTHPHVRLVVVDTWARVSPKTPNRQRSQYEDEYAALTPLKYLADTYRVSILAIHHLRKMRGDDVLDEITGSIGLTGAVDGALILKRERGQHEATLFVTGCDNEHEQQLALTFDARTAMWTLVGSAEEVKRTKERQEILALLTGQFPEGMSPRQVAEALHKKYHTTCSLLRKMEAAGEIRHVKSHSVAIPRDIFRNQRNQCNQRNQSVASTLQPAGQMTRGEEPCPSATDYSDYADESISTHVSQTHSISPPLAGASLRNPAASEDLPSEREDLQDAQDQREVSVINCHQRNQSMPSTTQAGDHVEQCSPTRSDYTDYVDYADDNVSSNRSQTHEPDPPPAGTSLQHSSAPEDLLTEGENVQGAQDLRDVAVISVINRNQCNQRNQSERSCPQTTLQVERSQGNSARHPNVASPGKARAGPCAPNKKRCPHHPHTRWIRFDPSGQAWCDWMDCWDCYRLMQIGEALDYRPLSEYTRGIVALEQGMEAWSSFVTSQGYFAVLTATQYAIAFCKALGVEVC
jgi:hypothetical protein